MARRSRLGVQLVGAWNAFTKALDPAAFERRLDRQLAVAHARMGRQFVATARSAIRAENYTPNSALTTALKGSSKPLVDTGDLFQSITFEVTEGSKQRGVRVGLIRAKSGQQVVNIGAILHEGATIRTGDAKARIVRIPARPFLLEPLNEPVFITFVRETWSEAVRTALFPPGGG